MEYTKEQIKENLSTNLSWMERTVIVLYNRQTEDEKFSKETKHQNGIGFNGTDSRYLTWVAEYLLKGNHLSGRHIEKVGKKLPKYWRQVKELIEERNG